MKTMMKKIFLAVLLAFGMALPACEPTGESLLAIEETLADESKAGTSGKFLAAGLVVGVRQQKGSPHLWLILRKTPVDNKDRPRCGGPKGRRLSLDLAIPFTLVRTHRQTSAFVILGSAPDPATPPLEKGMCITVRDDSREAPPILPLIEILLPPPPGPSHERIETGIVTIWSGPVRQTRRRPTNANRDFLNPFPGRSPKKAA